MNTAKAILFAALAAFAAGCSSYRWEPAVPAGMRTVSVPVFRNEGNVTALGDEVTRQLLRELQREGSFRLARPGDAAVEVQGSVKSSDPRAFAYGRHTGARIREHELKATATVSFIDKKAGKVLVDGRRYRARVTFAAGDDVLTGSRDASRRLAEELARQIADDLVSWKL